jgi:hypothetical protein
MKRRALRDTFAWNQGKEEDRVSTNNLKPADPD